MMMVCEVGRRNGLDAGPLDPLAFWFMGAQTKRRRGACLGSSEHTTMAKQRGMGPHTHMMMVREDDRQKELDAGPLELPRKQKGENFLCFRQGV